LGLEHVSKRERDTENVKTRREVIVEFYGVPRLRAGRASVRVSASNVGEAIGALRRECPALDGTVLDGRGVHPAYRLSLNGERFVTDPDTPLLEGDALLLLSADVGG
jgi:molybdopterin converting factor small subunit